jgi:DNA-directed RNA polymerase specialized sigma24 family protein
MLREYVARASLDDERLLALWNVAWPMACECCGRTLARLRHGQGGFYGAADLQQDLFLEFWALLRHWPGPWPDEDDAGDEGVALWEAWRHMLWGGGIRVLRRAPQRLWSRGEWAVDPGRLALDDDADRATMTPLARAAARELVDTEDGAATGERLQRLEGLERALWALPPAQRQAIYMGVLAELPGMEAGRRLGLPAVNTFYQRLHAARAALRRRML